MDRELKKALKRLLWLDDILGSTDSAGSVFDDIEDELEEMFGRSGDKSVRLIDWLKSNRNDDDNL